MAIKLKVDNVTENRTMPLLVLNCIRYMGILELHALFSFGVYKPLLRAFPQSNMTILTESKRSVVWHPTRVGPSHLQIYTTGNHTHLLGNAAKLVDLRLMWVSHR